MPRPILLASVLMLAFTSAGCLTSTPAAHDASADDSQNNKGTGARDLTNATPGPSNPGKNPEDGPGSTGEGLGAGSGTGTGAPPENVGPTNSGSGQQGPGTGQQGAGPGPGPGTGSAGH